MRRIVSELGAHSTGTVRPSTRKADSRPAIFSGSSNEFSSQIDADASSMRRASTGATLPPLSASEVRHGSVGR